MHKVQSHNYGHNLKISKISVMKLPLQFKLHLNTIFYNNIIDYNAHHHICNLKPYMEINRKDHREVYKEIHTQRLLARTVCLTASTNCSTDGDGIHNLSAPIFIRRAFSSGRNRRIRPSSVLYAFSPSKIPYTDFWLALIC